MDRPDTPDAAAATDPRAVLLEQRAQLVAELDEISIRAPEQMTYGSQAAAASQVFEQQRDLALREHTRTAIAAIDAALVRLDAGMFGSCTSCGKAIGAERLAALPAAALCIDCQRTKGRR
jgi:DnaK suppressor protein